MSAYVNMRECQSILRMSDVVGFLDGIQRFKCKSCAYKVRILWILYIGFNNRRFCQQILNMHGPNKTQNWKRNMRKLNQPHEICSVFVCMLS